MANVNEGKRWTVNVCEDCGKYMREHPSYCDKTGRRHVGATNVWSVEVVPAEALREAKADEARLRDVLVGVHGVATNYGISSSGALRRIRAFVDAALVESESKTGGHE